MGWESWPLKNKTVDQLVCAVQIADRGIGKLFLAESAQVHLT
jgi:hypothetical protein